MNSELPIEAPESRKARAIDPFDFNFLDRAIAFVAPRAALQRAQARAVMRAYEAIKPSKQRRPKEEGRSPNAAAAPAVTKLRQQGRWFEQNSDLAVGILDALVDNTVGTGIVSNPSARLQNGELATELNSKMRRLWLAWGSRPRECDVTAANTWAGIQRTAARSKFRDGEIFGQMVSGNVTGLPDDRTVPFSLEMLEADMVPIELNEKVDKGMISQGILFNAWNRPTKYYVYKEHPGSGKVYLATKSGVDALKEVSAGRMLHCKLAHRFGQARGVSVFATIAKRLLDVSEIEDAERIAARVAASMSAFIKKGTPDFHYAPPQLDDAGNPIHEKRFLQFSPGAVFDDLLPGEDVGTINSSRPNNELIPFRNSQLKAISAGAGANYSTVARDYSGTYSSQRQSLIEAFQHYRPLTSLFIAHIVTPVYSTFVQAALSSGAITARDLRGVDMTTITNADHYGPAMPAIDPKKEADANIALNEAHLKTRQQIVSERGALWDETLAQLERERNELDNAGLLDGADASGMLPESGDDDPNASSDGTPQLVAA